MLCSTTSTASSKNRNKLASNCFDGCVDVIHFSTHSVVRKLSLKLKKQRERKTDECRRKTEHCSRVFVSPTILPFGLEIRMRILPVICIACSCSLSMPQLIQWEWVPFFLSFTSDHFSHTHQFQEIYQQPIQSQGHRKAHSILLAFETIKWY